MLEKYQEVKDQSAGLVNVVLKNTGGLVNIGAAGVTGFLLTTAPAATGVVAAIAHTSHWIATNINPRANHAPIYRDIDSLQERVDRLENTVRDQHDLICKLVGKEI
jgi:hypothetical protein